LGVSAHSGNQSQQTVHTFFKYFSLAPTSSIHSRLAPCIGVSPLSIPPPGKVRYFFLFWN